MAWAGKVVVFTYSRILLTLFSGATSKAGILVRLDPTYCPFFPVALSSFHSSFIIHDSASISLHQKDAVENVDESANVSGSAAAAATAAAAHHPTSYILLPTYMIPAAAKCRPTN